MEIWVIFLWIWLFVKPTEVVNTVNTRYSDRVYVYNRSTWPTTLVPLHTAADTTKTCQECHDDLLAR